MLSKEDSAHVVAAIREVEQRTASEVVVAVLHASDRYDDFRGVTSLLLALSTLLLLDVAFPDVPAAWFLAAVLPATLLFRLLIRGPLLRSLVPRAIMEQRVKQTAFRLFSERGVHNTRDHTGVLVLLSEQEHQAVILGDRGIDTFIGAEGWSKFIGTLTAGIRDGLAAAALVEVLGELGQVLAKHFPRQEDDENELPDDLIAG